MGQSLTERDKSTIWHPYTAQKYASDPIPVVKGSGSWLIGENGSRYLDAISSWWVTIHGHAHPHIARRIHEQALQLEQVIFAGFTHEPAVSLAEKLLGLLPGSFSRIFYSDNGSTATEVAIKMAIQYWWNLGITTRHRVLALHHGYHGDTFGAMSISERGLFTKPYENRLFNVTFADIHAYNPAELETLLDECACVIYEPLIQGAGGMKMYPPETLEKFLQQCKAHQVICIADEVMTGFGRTGKLFASEHCVTTPDIICLSKGLTGGAMALGVTACTANIHEAFIHDDKLKTFFHGHSFTANPLACAAALASLEIFKEEHTLQHIARIADKNASFAMELGRKKQMLGIDNIRRTGTIVAFEVKDTEEGYTSAVKERITARALQKGVYLRPLGNTVYIMPPYCTTDEELEKIYGVIFDIL